MKTTVLTPRELEQQHVLLWRRWLDAAGHPPNSFLAPEFAVLAGRHRPTARVAVLEDESGIAGFFPFDAAGPRVAKSLAAGVTDVQALTLRPGFDVDPGELFDQCRLSVYEFDRLLPHIAQQLGAKSIALLPSPVIDLSPGWETWLELKRKTSASRFRRMLQKQRQIGKEIGEIDFTFASTSHADLDQLMAWKSAQFVRTGRRDRFAQPWLRNLLHDLLDGVGGDLGITLSTLRAGDRMLAMDVGLSYGTSIAGWFPAYDVEYQRYSTGNVCLLMQIESACNAGYQRMDLGVGSADYKESFKNYDFEVAEGWCERPSATAFIRRTSKMPQRVATQVVLGSPALRRTARSALNFAGSVRTRVRRPSSPQV